MTATTTAEPWFALAYPSIRSSIPIAFPNACAACGGEANQYYAHEASVRSAQMIQTLKLSIPLCATCLAKAYELDQKPIMYGLLAAGAATCIVIAAAFVSVPLAVLTGFLGYIAAAITAQQLSDSRYKLHPLWTTFRIEPTPLGFKVSFRSKPLAIAFARLNDSRLLAEGAALTARLGAFGKQFLEKDLSRDEYKAWCTDTAAQATAEELLSRPKAPTGQA